MRVSPADGTDFTAWGGHMRRSVLSLAVVAALVAAGCGDDDDDSSSSEPAGTFTMFRCTDTRGIVLPHWRQNATPKNCAPGNGKSAISSSPRVHLKASAG